MQRIDIYAGTDIKGPREKEGNYWYAVVLSSAPEYFVGKTEKIRATENAAVLTALAHALARIRKPCAMRIQAMDFFMRCIQAPCSKIAVENPTGIMNTAFRAPDQIIEPFQFANRPGRRGELCNKENLLMA